jgi:hypothetical protein
VITSNSTNAGRVLKQWREKMVACPSYRVCYKRLLQEFWQRISQRTRMDGTARTPVQRSQTFAEQAASDEKHGWAETTRHGFTAAWKFVTTPTGFLMTVYGLNVVAWGAMLFFLLLGAAPAMNHPSKDAINSPRKIWIEIDSQILNALFCVTGFGLAPWRFRDLYWLIKARRFKNSYATKRLNEQNRSWFDHLPSIMKMEMVGYR